MGTKCERAGGIHTSGIRDVHKFRLNTLRTRNYGKSEIDITHA